MTRTTHIDETAYNQLTAIEKAGYKEQKQFKGSHSGTWHDCIFRLNHYTNQGLATRRIYIPIEPETVKEEKPHMAWWNSLSDEQTVQVLKDNHIFGHDMGVTEEEIKNFYYDDLPAIATTENILINDKGESAEDNEPIFDNIIWDEYNERYPDAEDGYRYDKFEEGAQFGRIWAQQQYAQKVKAIIGEESERLIKEIDNLPNGLSHAFVSAYLNAQLKQTRHILTQLNNIK